MTHQPNSEAADKNSRANVAEAIREARALISGQAVPTLRLYQHPSRKK